MNSRVSGQCLYTRIKLPVYFRNKIPVLNFSTINCYTYIMYTCD